MTVEIHITGRDAYEARDQMAELLRGDGPPPMAPEQAKIAADLNAALAAAPKTVEVEPKKPRSATKKELAEQAASVAATAKADAEARVEGKNIDGTERKEAVVEKTEPPAITAEEVKNSIIDLLNDWSEAAPSDPDIRTANLGPMLRTLDADKIRNIDASKYAMVPALIDESRAKLAEFKAASAVEE